MATPPGATHYIPVTTNPAKVPSAQTNFTADLIIDEALGINDEGSALAFVRALAGDYSDVQVTNEAGDVNWSFNVDEFDQRPGTTKLVAASRMPSLSGAVGVVNKWWRGCTGGPFASGPNTYRTADGWAGRWSLKEAAGDLLDSTSNANDGTRIGTVQTAGQVGLGQQFDDSNDYINLGNHASLAPADAITISVWLDWIAGSDTISYKGFSPGCWIIENGNFLFSVGSGWVSPTPIYWSKPLVGCHHYVFTCEDGGTAALYRDGALVGTTTNNTTFVPAAGTSLWLGRSLGGYYLGGNLDEYQFASVIRSADWSETLFNCQSGNDAFWTVGAQEAVTEVVPPLRLANLQRQSVHLADLRRQGIQLDELGRKTIHADLD